MNADQLRQLENRLWSAADQLRANSKLRANEYSVPVLGLIFLKYADVRFERAKAELEAEGGSRRRGLSKERFQAKGVMFVPDAARYDALLALTEGDDVGRAVNDAMKAIEEENPDLRGVLPKTFPRFESSVLVELLRTFAGIPDDMEGDAFGKIYEYFLSNFAMSEGQRGGEFFTPTSIVKLIVEIIEPYRGRILDPACGSGGMFVQSAEFVERHKGDNGGRLSVYGEERVAETIRLAKMNLAVHGLSGDIRQGNSYYEDPHNLVGKFDFVMANPPFNVDSVDKERLEGDARFPFGLPNSNNANYLWIQLFYSALNDHGRAGFVMANSASDARHSEQEIRRKLIESGAVDVIVAVSSNFFYTVTLPVTLWFLDKGKPEQRNDKVLFIDARKVFRQVTRAVRDFTPEQGEFLANIVRLYRGEEAEFERGSEEMTREAFPANTYLDVAGLCGSPSLEEIEGQGWSLNSGRYVGVTSGDAADVDFELELEHAREEFELLTSQSRELEETITEVISRLQEPA